MLENCKGTGKINIDCVDPLGRSALLMAIDNENLEMVELLLENKVGLHTYTLGLQTFTHLACAHTLGL